MTKDDFWLQLQSVMLTVCSLTICYQSYLRRLSLLFIVLSAIFFSLFALKLDYEFGTHDVQEDVFTKSVQLSSHIFSEEQRDQISILGFGFSTSGWSEIPDLRDQVGLLYVDSRPDAHEHEKNHIHLCLFRPSARPEITQVELDEWLPVRFTDGVFSILPHDSDSNLLMLFSYSSNDSIEARVRSSPLNSENLDFPVENSKFTVKKVKLKEPFFGISRSILSDCGAMWSGKDLLIPDYDSRHGLEKITFVKGHHPNEYSIFLGLGDYMTLNEDGVWSVKKPDKSTVDKTLLKLTGLSEGRLDFDGWGPSDGTSLNVVLNKNPNDLDLCKFKDVEVVGVRSKEKVVLKLGKRREKIRVGEYLMLSGQDWAVVKDFMDIIDDLGEVMQVNNVDRVGGRWTVSATLYNSNRSSKMDIYIDEKGIRAKS